MNVLKRKLFWFFLALLLAGGIGWRLTRTAEFIAYFGSDRARAELCRAIPSLSARRREALLPRLLQDPVEAVRLAGITACGRGEVIPAVDDLLERMLESDSTPGLERGRAGDVLQERTPIRGSVLKYLRSKAKESGFRRQCPRQVAFILSRDLDQASLEDREQMVNLSLKEDDPACVCLQKLILDRVEFFRPWQERLADPRTAGGSGDLERFCASAAAALEALQEQAGEGGAAPGSEPQTQDDYSIYEAAWMQDLRPNYQIATFQDRRCLTLEEGAGGVMPWLKGEDGTVDVGETRFSLYAPRDATYQLWVKVYFDDKCGNSIGLWLDDLSCQNFSDQKDRFRVWHWLPLYAEKVESLRLKKGFHKGRMQAYEDGVYLDQLALLPLGVDPERQNLKPQPYWDRSLPSTLSISVKQQSQYRGTAQPVTVWVRRNSPALTEGTLHLKLPAPFVFAGSEADQILRFAKENPLASATFQVRLPAQAAAGESVLRAVYTDVSGRKVTGEMILGGQFDWLSTGPLEPGDPRNQKLQKATQVEDADLRQGWSRYPAQGCDPYRRLNLAWAYGEIRNKFCYFCADFMASESGEFLALLTVDDTACVFIDGRKVIEQPEGGPGEGRLVMTPFRLEAGRHRIFARVYQDAAANPEDADKYRHTWNHCIFKLLLRQSRHQPAETLKGLPMGAEVP